MQQGSLTFRSSGCNTESSQEDTHRGHMCGHLKCLTDDDASPLIPSLELRLKETAPESRWLKLRKYSLKQVEATTAL